MRTAHEESTAFLPSPRTPSSLLVYPPLLDCFASSLNLTRLERCFRSGLTPVLYTYYKQIHARVGYCPLPPSLSNATFGVPLPPLLIPFLLPLQFHSFNSVINALGMAGRWEDALGVMEDMVLEQVTPNSVTYASAINACGKSRQLRRALGLLREAHLAGIEVSSATLGFCNATKHVGHRFSLYTIMKRNRSVIFLRSMAVPLGMQDSPG